MTVRSTASSLLGVSTSTKTTEGWYQLLTVNPCFRSLFEAFSVTFVDQVRDKR